MADFDAATSILGLAMPRDQKVGGQDTAPNIIKRFDNEKDPPSVDGNTKKKHVKTMLKKKGGAVNKSKGGAKDKKPKRPLSAYNLFFRDERNKILKNGVDGDTGSANTNPFPSSTGVALGPGSYVKTGIAEADNGKRARTFIAQETNQVAAMAPATRRPPRFDEMAKIIGLRWKNLRDTDPDRLATYKKLADAEMDRYRVALKEFNEAKEKAEKGEVSSGTGDDSNKAVENGGGTPSAKVEQVQKIPQAVARASSAHPAPTASVPPRSTGRRVVNTAAPPPIHIPPPSSSKATSVRRLPQNRSVAFNPPPPPLPLGGGGRVAPLTKPLPSQHFHRFAPRPKAAAPPSGPTVGYANGYASTNSATKRTRGGEVNSCEHQGITVERRGSSMSCTYEPQIQDAVQQAVMERRRSSMSCSNTSYQSSAQQAAALERNGARMSRPYESRPIAPVVTAGQSASASVIPPPSQPPPSSTTDVMFRHVLEEENRRLAAQNELMVAALVRAEEDRKRQDQQVAALASAVALSGRGNAGVDPLSVLLARGGGMERRDLGAPSASTPSPPSLPNTTTEELLSMMSASSSSQYHQSLMESALGSLLNRRS